MNCREQINKVLKEMEGKDNKEKINKVIKWSS